MKSKTLILFSAFILSSLFVQAQISKNTQSISGYSSLGINHIYRNKSTTNIFFASFNPRYGKFLGQKTLVTLQPIASFNRFEANSMEKAYFNISNLGFNTNIRHYLNVLFPIKFYVEGKIALEASKYQSSDSKLNFKNTTEAIAIALGANYFLNKTVALNGQLGYKRTDFISKNSNLPDNFNIGLSIENFINAESEVGEGEKLIQKGRKSIGGNFDISINDFTTTYQLNTNFSQFVTDGFLIGGSFNGTKTDLSLLRFSIQLNTRYYLPINKKLFLYPEMKLTYIDYWSSKFDYNLNIGMNYFIKKHIALEINYLGLNLKKGQINIFAGADVSLKYFLD
jgi:hypothetical protein